MSTEQTGADPLSDEAFWKWDAEFNRLHMDVSFSEHALDGWQECARRATEKRDADLESLHVYYRAEIKRLRELLSELADLSECYAGPEGPDNTIDVQLGYAIVAARAALEGRP